jgi:hypothetical protein
MGRLSSPDKKSFFQSKNFHFWMIGRAILWSKAFSVNNNIALAANRILGYDCMGRNYTFVLVRRRDEV